VGVDVVLGLAFPALPGREMMGRITFSVIASRQNRGWKRARCGCEDDPAIDTNGLPAPIRGDLYLPSGRSEIKLIGFANFREALREAVGNLDGHGAHSAVFVALETEHQPRFTRAPVSTALAMSGDWRLTLT